MDTQSYFRSDDLDGRFHNWRKPSKAQNHLLHAVFQCSYNSLVSLNSRILLFGDMSIFSSVHIF